MTLTHAQRQKHTKVGKDGSTKGIDTRVVHKVHPVQLFPGNRVYTKKCRDAPRLYIFMLPLHVYQYLFRTVIPSYSCNFQFFIAFFFAFTLKTKSSTNANRASHWAKSLKAIGKCMGYTSEVSNFSSLCRNTRSSVSASLDMHLYMSASWLISTSTQFRYKCNWLSWLWSSDRCGYRAYA